MWPASACRRTLQQSLPTQVNRPPPLPRTNRLGHSYRRHQYPDSGKLLSSEPTFACFAYDCKRQHPGNLFPQAPHQCWAKNLRSSYLRGHVLQRWVMGTDPRHATQPHHNPAINCHNPATINQQSKVLSDHTDIGARIICLKTRIVDEDSTSRSQSL